ncbi:hypothetical protein ScPMuIL_006106 [Solemya velum]
MKYTIGILFYLAVKVVLADEACTAINGKCQDRSIRCNGRYVQWKCYGDVSRQCCRPDVNLNSDQDCTAINGKCQDVSTWCNGDYEKGKCGGAFSRQCCRPSVSLNPDRLCTAIKGKCQLKTSNTCDGIYVPGKCAGNANRQCCQSDRLCTAIKGKCQLKISNPCDGIYVPGKCAGNAYRQCCQSDEDCRAAEGHCQHKSSDCDGGYVKGKCAGDFDRQCCLPNVNPQSTGGEEMDCQKQGGVCQKENDDCVDRTHEPSFVCKEGGTKCCIDMYDLSEMVIMGGLSLGSMLGVDMSKYPDFDPADYLDSSSDFDPADYLDSSSVPENTVNKEDELLPTDVNQNNEAFQIARFEPPFEHLWDELDRRVRQRQPPPQSLQQLVNALQAEWANIPEQVIRNLTSSTGRRCQAVIDANGGHTRY